MFPQVIKDEAQDSINIAYLEWDSLEISLTVVLRTELSWNRTRDEGEQDAASELD